MTDIPPARAPAAAAADRPGDAAALAAREAAIDRLLPQTQCTRCGYDGCRPYAAALARGEAAINRCPPGGDAGIARLAQFLGTPILPLDPECGAAAPPEVAVIIEERCIGCAKCLAACPVDAIIGARKRMHTVLADGCTGCALCLPPCPVDCIEMRPGGVLPDPDLSRQRYAQHLARRERDAADRADRLAALEARTLP